MSRKSSLPLGAAVALASVLGACTNNANTRSDFSATVAISPTRKMYIECRGNGSPTVILVAGQRGFAAEWSLTESRTVPPQPAVFGAVARFTRVCAYDRPGTPVGESFSRSDPAPQPTTAAAATADLQALLRSAGESAPCEYPDIERFDADATFAQLRAVPPLRPMPLAVLSSDASIGQLVQDMAANGQLPAGVPADFGYTTGGSRGAAT